MQNTEEIFANLIQTLTSSGYRVFNPKTRGVYGRSPGGDVGGKAPTKNEKKFYILSVNKLSGRDFVCST